MSKINMQDMLQMQKLSRLKLDENKLESLLVDCNNLLTHIQKLDRVTSSSNGASHSFTLPKHGDLPIEKDVCQDSFSKTEALKNAANANDTYFLVPKVIDHS